MSEPHPVTIEELIALATSVEETYVQLGYRLREVRDGQLFVDWGFADFDTFGEAVLRYKPRKVRYLIRVVELLERCGVTPDERRGIGWSKLLMLEPVLTPENKAEWLDRAKQGTSEQLRHAVAKARGFAVSDEPRKLFSILLQADQHLVVEEALALGLNVAGTDSRSVALAAMAAEAISSWSPLVAREAELAGGAHEPTGEGSA